MPGQQVVLSGREDAFPSAGFLGYGEAETKVDVCWFAPGFQGHWARAEAG